MHCCQSPRRQNGNVKDLEPNKSEPKIQKCQIQVNVNAIALRPTLVVNPREIGNLAASARFSCDSAVLCCFLHCVLCDLCSLVSCFEMFLFFFFYTRMLRCVFVFCKFVLYCDVFVAYKRVVTCVLCQRATGSNLWIAWDTDSFHSDDAARCDSFSSMPRFNSHDIIVWQLHLNRQWRARKEVICIAFANSFHKGIALLGLNKTFPWLLCLIISNT